MSLQEPSFFILTALAREPRHGYGVMPAVGGRAASTPGHRPPAASGDGVSHGRGR